MKRIAWRGLGLSILGLFMGLLAACPSSEDVRPTSNTTNLAPMSVDWPLFATRRSSNYLRLDLPSVVVGTKIDVGVMDGVAVQISSLRVYRSTMVSPRAEQMTGDPRITIDAGSYLVPLPLEQAEDHRVFEVKDPMPLYMKVDVAATAAPGDYRLPVIIKAPGREPITCAVLLTVSEIVLPTEQRVLAAATTTIDELSRLFPATFGSFNAGYLDRAEPEHAAAVAQLDTMVKAGQREGLALFVEDLCPAVKVDDVGRVNIDWDAYDRVMSPYMDGTAFADRVPLQVWLAPVPPRRIRDSAVQLRQYLATCAEHFAAKGWVATPAFMHPALVEAMGDAAESPEKAELRTQISKILQMHMSRDVLAVTTPDGQVPHPRMWVVDDTDPRLPPAGALATEQSVRVWPWVCAARGVKGFVWRGAVEHADEVAKGQENVLSPGAGRRPLLVAQAHQSKDKKGAATGEQVEVLPTLRMAWLNAGINDTAMLGLLEKRSDPSLVSEVLAGVVGRTGVTLSLAGAEIPTAPAGYLYAGWPGELKTWQALPLLMERLVLANDPGHQVKVSADDPIYLQAKVWLGDAHRPAARVGGYRFMLQQGREGAVVESLMDLLVENPVDSPTEMEFKFPNLPGDFDIAGATDIGGGKLERTIEGYGLARVGVKMAAHLESIRECPALTDALVRERTGSAMVHLPLTVPIYRMKSFQMSPRVDGRGDDWPQDAAGAAFGPMPVGLRYLSRVDVLKGAVRQEQTPAIARWTYDNDFLYALIRCDQNGMSDEKNNEWPSQDGRWWGTDGVQVQVCGGGVLTGKKVFVVGIKPSGVVLTRVGKVESGMNTASIKWAEGPANVKFGITTDKTGYLVELAIPRKWFSEPNPPATATGGGRSDGAVGGAALWRINILRHRASDLESASWSGPVVDDTDIGMMGLLVGE